MKINISEHLHFSISAISTTFYFRGDSFKDQYQVHFYFSLFLNFYRSRFLFSRVTSKSSSHHFERSRRHFLTIKKKSLFYQKPQEAPPLHTPSHSHFLLKYSIKTLYQTCNLFYIGLYIFISFL